MLDTIDRTEIETPRTELMEADARAQLERIARSGERRPSIRALAQDWGWAPATVGRFVQKFDGETGALVRETTIETDETPEPTPHQRRAMLIEGTKDFDAKFKPETAEEAVDRFIAECGMPRSRADEDQEGEFVWVIPRQAEIACVAIEDGGVQIEQEDQHGDVPQTIIVAAGNVVALARHILWAAGFKTIGIYTHERGGHVDIEDGQLARNFRGDK